MILPLFVKDQQPHSQQDFFNPKSMLTPGIAGAATMLITNALASQFGLPANYTALTISLVIGVIVLRSTTGSSIVERLILYILNSLVIFSVAIGTNQAGVTATTGKRLGFASPRESQSVKYSKPFFSEWFSADAVRYVQEWLDHRIDDDELRDLLLGEKDLNELKRLRREGERQIEREDAPQ
jgi:hypothetical protein